ncbi:MAG: SdpI family protein [Candidatus Cybelea sp.]
MRRWWLVGGLGLVLLAVALSVWAYPALPQRVPTSWSLSGEAAGYSSRLGAVALFPVLAAFIWVLMIVLPAISPRGFRLDASLTPFYETCLAVIAVFVAIQGVILRAQIAGTVPSISLIFAFIGVLLAVIGILVGRVSKNFFMGYRTPWTLVSDRVWLRTNALGGRLMVVGGLLLIACSPFTNVIVAALIAVFAVVVAVPIAYSYVLYRRLEG